MNTNHNIQTLVNAGYCVSPNNIWGLPGVVMYASGPGIMEYKQALTDLYVAPVGVSLVKSCWQDGWFVGLHTMESFVDADAYLAWVAANGTRSEGGAYLDQGVCD